MSAFALPPSPFVSHCQHYATPPCFGRWHNLWTALSVRECYGGYDCHLHHYHPDHYHHHQIFHIKAALYTFTWVFCSYLISFASFFSNCSTLLCSVLSYFALNFSVLCCSALLRSFFLCSIILLFCVMFYYSVLLWFVLLWYVLIFYILLSFWHGYLDKW